MLPNYSVIFVVLFNYHKWLDSDKIYKEVKTKFTLRYHYPIKLKIYTTQYLQVCKPGVDDLHL